MNGRLKAMIVLAVIIGVGYAIKADDAAAPVVTSAPKETYRLVHAIGNSERINARGLSISECETGKREQLIVVASLGTGGSVTCLPESVFSD